MSISLLGTRGYCVAALALLTGCSGGGAVPANTAASRISQQATQAAAWVAPAAAPVIKTVSTILPEQTQTITISGTGFGVHKPHNGNTRFLEVSDVTTHWSAGYGFDAVNLNVTGWKNTTITIAGFTGGYGSNGWVLLKGDKIVVRVWNPQTKQGPAKHHTTVK
jgi:hypothetical protein